MLKHLVAPSLGPQTELHILLYKNSECQQRPVQTSQAWPSLHFAIKDVQCSLVWLHYMSPTIWKYTKNVNVRKGIKWSWYPRKKAAWLGWPGPAQAGLGWPRQDMASLGRPRPAQASKNLKITLAWPGRGRPRPAQAGPGQSTTLNGDFHWPWPAQAGLVQPGPALSNLGQSMLVFKRFPLRPSLDRASLAILCYDF